MTDVKKIISQLTLEEKAGLCSGEGFWHTKKIERLNVPDIMVSDGPHGLRKQDTTEDNLGVNDSISAVCFPTGCALASSFSEELMYEVGQTIGKECRKEDVQVILGPAVNIKRTPLCGRNFEYYSEDPYLSSLIASSFISGVQSQNVGTSIKHFCANNQETRRMSVDEHIDERTLREIYLASFEKAVQDAKPWTVMSSYNKVNGTYVGENHKLLTDILRKEWGFDGFVVSDWGAVGDRVNALKAGLDLEMPTSLGMRDKQIVDAVRDGSLSEEVLDTACERILNIVYRSRDLKDQVTADFNEDHEKARKYANETIVLLKNDKDVLPLDSSKKIAFVGKYAKTPRFQGGGSSHINCIKTTSALESLEEYNIKVSYAQGYKDDVDEIDISMEKEAIAIAAESDITVIFAGLPDAFESEGFDRKHMDMPMCQNHLIDEITKVCNKVVVVLHNGSVIEMPWANKVDGIIEAYLGGEAIGAAVCDVLFGKVNPCGKLAETFPVKLEDNPSYLSGFGSGDGVDYSEGLFVGYRYYDKKKMDVLFPFGHGLSYTTYEYSNLTVNKTVMDENDTMEVSLDVKNTGNMAGKEIVELYVSDKESTVIRPVKELKGVKKVYLEQGESKKVTFRLSKRAFAYYEPKLNDWHVESGEFDILIGKSSRNIVLCKTVTVTSDIRVPVEYTMDTTVGDIIKNPQAAGIISPLVKAYKEGDLSVQGESSEESISEEMNDSMLENLPIHAMLSFTSGKVTPDMIENAVSELKKLNQ